MDVSRYLSAASFWTPEHVFRPLSGLRHVPFLFWLVDAARPRVIVEQTAKPGNTYFACCQAVRSLEHQARCFALEPHRHEHRAAPIGSHLDRQAQEVNNECFRQFSRLIDATSPEEVCEFEDGSVDLLHFQPAPNGPALRDDLDLWLPKLSDSSIVLVQRTNHHMHASSVGRFFDELAGEYPTFEFLHDYGMGVVGVGAAIPEQVRALLDAGLQPRLRDEIRRTYTHLGQAVLDRLLRDDLQKHIQSGGSEELIPDLGEPDRPARTRLDAHPDQAGHGPEIPAPGRRSETVVLRNKLSLIEQKNRDLTEEIERFQRSAAWALMQKARGLRMRLFRDGRLSGKCWNAFAGFVRVSAASGMRVAFQKAHAKIQRKLKTTRRRDGSKGTNSGMPGKLADDPQTAFTSLGWRFNGEKAGRHKGSSGRFKLLLISHAACRTGCAYCLLHLAEEFTKLPDLECWIVLQQGGELAKEFARVAPTLDMSELVQYGMSRSELPGVIAEAFAAYAGRGLAICNTMAVSEFHAAFAEHQVPVLSWIHELPTMVDLFGGELAVERIKAVSRQIIVPAGIVRKAWVEQFGVDPAIVHAVYYGQAPRTSGISRELARSRVLKELDLPTDARIVLGCGTVDLRKGADLFAQVARRVLIDPRAGELAEKTWFVWVGHSDQEHIRHWLMHDAALHGLHNRVILTGPRSDTVPYFLAADLFALTSREDPCPIVNLEAMESGLPVVAFEDAGGAPEVLDRAGVAVPYLDVAAMADEILSLLQDDPRRQEMGRLGRAIVRETLTWPRFMASLLAILKESYDYHPPRRLDVSVIVPSYRHSSYLEERLRSIFRQTHAPREIIFLDDASPDDSLEVAPPAGRGIARSHAYHQQRDEQRQHVPAVAQGAEAGHRRPGLDRRIGRHLPSRVPGTARPRIL